jgi:hypothetical protein
MKTPVTLAAAFAIGSLTAIAVPMQTAHADHKSAAKPSGPIAADTATWVPLVAELGDKGPQVQVVFGDLKKKKAPIGLLLKLPAGFTPGPHTHSSDYSGVVIYGELLDAPPGELGSAEKLTAGRRWTEAANHPHDNQCTPKGECLELVYFPKGFDFKPIAK